MKKKSCFNKQVWLLVPGVKTIFIVFILRFVILQGSLQLPAC